MKTFFHVIPLLFCQLFTHAQDTLWLRNNAIEVGKVIEIGYDYVKFVRAGSENGPVFIKLKTELDYIRFKNREIIRFNEITPAEPDVVATNIEYSRILLKGKKLYYQGERISTADLHTLILNHPNVEIQKLLLQEFERFNSLRKKHNVWKVSGPLITAVLPFIGYCYAILYGNPVPLGIGVAAASVSLGVSITAAQMLKEKKLKQLSSLVKIYNSNLK